MSQMKKRMVTSGVSIPWSTALRSDMSMVSAHLLSGGKAVYGTTYQETTPASVSDTRALTRKEAALHKLR